MSRIAMSLEYDGSAYCGWQSQPGQLTVQTTLEHALTRIAAHPIEVVCAGRTDKGVHASEQIIHFDSDSLRDERAWIWGGNSYLPKNIRLHWARTVSDDFHARFSAQSRRYAYVLQTTAIPPAILEPYISWHWRGGLNVEAMSKAAALFLGEHDFSSLRAAGCQAKTAIRKIIFSELKQQQNFIIFEVEANAFLYHMVRNIMGVLLEIGWGRQPLDWVKELLEAKDRRLAALTAPPNGLYLSQVKYPKRFELPEVLRKPWFLS